MALTFPLHSNERLAAVMFSVLLGSGLSACSSDETAGPMRAPLGEAEPRESAGKTGSSNRKPTGSAETTVGTGRPDKDPRANGTAGQGGQQGSSGAEPSGETPAVGSDGRVRINEVGCRNPEFVELINRGSSTADLIRFALADRDEPSAAVRLSGTLAPGGRASFALGGLACDEEPAVLFEDGAAVDQARPPLMPANASFARLPDGAGQFALATPTPEQPNRAFIDEAARLFLELTEPVPLALPELHISLPSNAVASLRGVTTGSPRPWLAATLTFRDARGEVGPISTGIHLKGKSVFRDIDGKAAFRLDFDRFEDGSSLFGIEHLTLNNFVQDQSASHERVFYGLLTRQGWPAPRVGYVNVWVNDEPFGVYLALESSNEQSFLGRNFASTALLYEGTYGMDLYTTHVDDFDEDYGSDPGRSTLARMVDTLEGVNDATLIADTKDLIDWEQLVPQMAADLFTGHYDSYTINRNNFTFHFDDRRRLRLITSGPDQAFEQEARRNPDGSRLLGHCLANATCTAALDDAIAHIAADTRAFLSDGGADRLREDAARLTSAFEDDPRTEWSYRNIEQYVDEMITFIERSASAL